MTEEYDDDIDMWEDNSEFNPVSRSKKKKKWLPIVLIALAVIVVLLTTLVIVGANAPKPVPAAAPTPTVSTPARPVTRPTVKPTAKPTLVAHKVADVTNAIDKLTTANCTWLDQGSTTYYETVSCDDAGLYAVYTTTDVKNFILMSDLNDDLEGVRYVQGANWLVCDLFAKTRGVGTVQNIQKLLGGTLGQF